MNLTPVARVGIARRLSRLLMVVSLMTACATVVAVQSNAIAVTDVTLIDGTGARPRVVTVIVEGDRITAIARNGERRPWMTSFVFDARAPTEAFLVLRLRQPGQSCNVHCRSRHHR